MGCLEVSKALVSSDLHDYRVAGAVAEAWAVLELGDSRRSAQLAERVAATIETHGCSPRLRTILADLHIRLALEAGDQTAAVRVAREARARHERRARELPAENRHLYWENSPWVSRAKTRIDDVLRDP